FSWNLTLQAYIPNHDLEQARSVLGSMPPQEIVSSNTMISRPGTCSAPSSSSIASLPKNSITWNTMIEMYSQSGNLGEAEAVFHSMPEETLVSSTSMIVAYAHNGHLSCAPKDLFDRMPTRNVVTWRTMITAYAQAGHMEQAKILFEDAPDLNEVTFTAMIDGYASNGSMEEAKALSDRLPNKDVAWNSMVCRYAANGHLDEALDSFQKMAHQNARVGLMDCSGGHGCFHRHVTEALETFHRTIQESMMPNHIVFMSMFVACCHLGGEDFSRLLLVNDSRLWSQAIGEHYCGFVDMFPRAKELDKAKELIHSMPFKPQSVAWVSLLAAC
ncbi:hypothetical protein SELMODRAFT_30076, partial [Selaginella moellendorffii]